MKQLELPKGYRTVVDELGAVQQKLREHDARLKPLRDREKELRAEVLEWCKPLAKDQDMALEGAHYTLAVSARRIERKVVSMLKLFNFLGRALFLKGCSVPGCYIDEHLTPAQQKQIVEEDYTGPRVLTTSPRMAAVQRKAA